MSGLAHYPVFAVLRAEDLARATKFYTDVLGFAVNDRYSVDGMMAFDAGAGTTVSVYERPGMPAPQNTTLSIPVPADEFEACIEYLRGKGVALEEYDIPEIGLVTVNGVATLDTGKTAWFKDTEGNIINVVTM